MFHQRISQTKKRPVTLAVTGSLLIALLAIAPELATQIAAGMMLAGSLVFVSVYSRSHWRQTKPGQAIMYIMIVAGIFGMYMLYITISHHYPVNLYLRGGLYVVTALAVVNLLWVLVLARRS